MADAQTETTAPEPVVESVESTITSEAFDATFRDIESVIEGV